MKHTNQYAVYLTMYTGALLPRWYIGSSTKDKITDGYRGSVCSRKYMAIWKSELKDNPALFTTRILSLHKTRKEALEEEYRVQQLHKVVSNTRYINMAYANVNGYFGLENGGELHPRFGGTHTETSRERISTNHADVSGPNNPMFGKHMSTETKRKSRYTRQLNGKWYSLNKDGNTVVPLITADEVRKLSEALIRATEKVPLGSNKVSYDRFVKMGKEGLVGMYALSIDPSTEEKDKYLKEVIWKN